MRAVIHIILHFLVPAAVARGAWPKQWKKAWAIMVATMVVDIDHLLADPIFDPNRCSIGFHPLHSYPLIALYCVLLWSPRFRILATGLLIHMALDGVDCIWMRWE
jgi:hypothetical protein